MTETKELYLANITNAHIESFRLIPLGEIIPSAENNRDKMEVIETMDLAASIESKGLINEISIRSIEFVNLKAFGLDEKKLPPGTKYMIICGNRRLEAYKILMQKHPSEPKFMTIPSKIHECDDLEAEALGDIENIQRKNLTTLQESKAINKLYLIYKSFGEVSRVIGKDINYVSSSIQILKLIPQLTGLLIKNILTREHAVLLAKLPAQTQKELFTSGQIYEKPDGYKDGTLESVVTCGQLKKIVEDEVYIDLNRAVFDIRDKSLNPSMGSCLECIFNTGFNTDLFRDLTDQSFCTDGLCFKKKMKRHIFNRKNELTSQKINVVFLREEANPYGSNDKQIDIYHTLPHGQYILHKPTTLESHNTVGIFVSLNAESKFLIGQEFKLENKPVIEPSKGSSSLSKSSPENKSKKSEPVETPLQIRERRLKSRQEREIDIDKIEVRRIVCQRIASQKKLTSSVIKEIASKIFFVFENNLLVLRQYNIDPIDFQDKETANIRYQYEIEKELQFLLSKIKTEIDLKTLMLYLIAYHNFQPLNNHEVNISSVNVDNTSKRLIQIAWEYGIKPTEIYKPIALKRGVQHNKELEDLRAAKKKSNLPLELHKQAIKDEKKSKQSKEKVSKALTDLQKKK